MGTVVAPEVPLVSHPVADVVESYLLQIHLKFLNLPLFTSFNKTNPHSSNNKREISQTEPKQLPHVNMIDFKSLFGIADRDFI